MPQAGVNKVILVGNVGNDPDVKFTPGGKAVAIFSVAVNESFKKRNGEKEARCEWLRCVCWNRLAEVAAEYVTKGRKLFIAVVCALESTTTEMGTHWMITELVVAQFEQLDGSHGLHQM